MLRNFIVQQHIVHYPVDEKTGRRSDYGVATLEGPALVASCRFGCWVTSFGEHHSSYIIVWMFVWFLENQSWKMILFFFQGG